jgi:tetratricopeptide (TPR) repeat protein
MQKTILPFYFVVTVLCILFFIYWPNLSGPFLLDDDTNIQPLIAETYSPSTIWHSIAKDGFSPQGRPVSKLSLVTTLMAHGNSPWAFKYHNLQIHLLIAVLLFWLAGRLLQSVYPPKSAWWMAAFTSVLWAISPIQVSTVLYPVQRMAQLPALFTVLGLLTISFAWSAVIKQQYKKTFFLLLILFPTSLFLAILSKENGVLLLIYCLLLGFLLPIKSANLTVYGRRILLFFTRGLIALLILGGLYFVLHWDRYTNYSGRNFNLTDRLLTQINVLVFYIKMILLPHVKEMTLFHDDFPITRSLNLHTIVSGVFLTMLLLGSWLARQRYPIITFGILWFFVSHLVESTVIPLEMIFEHRNYLAIFGLMLAATFSVNQLPITNSLKVFIGLLAIMLLLAMTAVRSHTWKTEDLLYQVNLQDHPNSARTHTTYANVLLKKHLLNKARQHLQKAIELQPFEAGAVLHLYATYCHEHKMPTKLVNKAIQILSETPISAYGLSSINALNQRKNANQCPVLSHAVLMQLINSAILYSKNHLNHGLEYLYRLKAQALIINHDLNGGTEYFNKAFMINKNTDVLFELVDFQIGAGQFSDARQNLNKLRHIDKTLHIDKAKIEFFEDLLEKHEQ